MLGDASADGLVHIGGRAAKRTSLPDGLVDTDAWAQVRPQFATVYVENKCHLRCDHCYESEASHPADARMSLADYERLFDDLANLGVLYLTLTGGEIFLRGDVLDIAALGRKKRFAVRLYTSGTLIDEARADRIRDLKISDVQISVYSADAAVHDAFVGQPGAHAKTLKALALLAERGVKTIVKTTAMTINVDALEALADMAQEVGAEFRVDPLVHPRMDGDRHPLRYLVDPQTLQQKMLANPRLYPAFQGRHAQSFCTGDNIRSDDDANCSAARRVISIAADGGVLACASFPVAAGNVRVTPLRDIWFKSAQLDAIRRTTFGAMTSCGSCSVKAGCDPCMAHALIEHDDHRACNASSLNMATALRHLADDRLALDARMERGHQLPIVGDHCAPAPAKDTPKGCGCGG